MASKIHPAGISRKSLTWLGKSQLVSSFTSHQKKWWVWIEWEALLLVTIVAGIFLFRLPDMSVRGEESRWATVAMEMVRTGDWVIPRQQGEPFLSRPPLGSWLIAVTTLIRGQPDVWAIRLPAVIATLLTSILVYGYSRMFLSRFGAFTAGIAYSTMGQVLQLGRVGETEAVFTFFVSASLLVWHWGYVRQWSGVWMWMAGYGLAALGALAKGPQAPLYFVVSTGMFLVICRDWRRLVSWSHLASLGVFAGIIAGWQIPFLLMLGWPAARAIWASDTAMRIWEINPWEVAKHLGTYPFEVVACTLPWSLFLLAFWSRKIRRSMGAKDANGVRLEMASGASDDPGLEQMILFLSVCLAVTFPTCWVIPGAHGRYFMPLFPCLAPLIGAVVERCVFADFKSKLQRVWRNSLAAMSFFMCVLALLIVSASWVGLPNVSLFIQEQKFSSVYAGCAVKLSAFLWCLRWGVPKTSPTLHGRWWTRHCALTGVCAVALFLGLTYDTVVMNFIIRKNGVTAEQIASLKERIPNGQALVSFGPIHHLFAYHFQDLIALKEWPLKNDNPNNLPEYFCFDRNKKQPMPFTWEEIASISCDRDRSDNPEEVVIVGRRLTPQSPAESDHLK